MPFLFLAEPFCTLVNREQEQAVSMNDHEVASCLAPDWCRLSPVWCGWANQAKEV